MDIFCQSELTTTVFSIKQYRQIHLCHFPGKFQQFSARFCHRNQFHISVQFLAHTLQFLHILTILLLLSLQFLSDGIDFCNLTNQCHHHNQIRFVIAIKNRCTCDDCPLSGSENLLTGHRLSALQHRKCTTHGYYAGFHQIFHVFPNHFGFSQTTDQLVTVIQIHRIRFPVCNINTVMKIVQNCFQIIFHLEISGIFFLQIHIFAPYKIAKMHQLIFIVNDFLHFYNMQKQFFHFF